MADATTKATNEASSGEPDAAATVAQALRRVETERERVRMRRRTQVLAAGVAVSVLVHIVIMVYLAMQIRLRPGTPGPTAVSYEFAIVQDEELTELEEDALTDLLPAENAVESAPEEPMTLDPTAAEVELAVDGAAALTTLGGSGGGQAGTGLAGGGAGTTFFGVSSRGTRFAFIIDRSASMANRGRMRRAMDETAAAIGGLPDFAYFHVIMFSNDTLAPPMQRGWMRAKPSNVTRLIRWLNNVDPTGSTEPMPAFYQVFALSPPPDVIFFLTDGVDLGGPAEEIAQLNGGGAKAVINTIAIGNPGAIEELRRIASESGGVPRFVEDN